MRRLKPTARLFFLVSFALGALSCGAPAPSRESTTGRSAEEASVEDSGKRLSAEFALVSLEDSYRQDHSQPKTVFSFDGSGSFKRQDGSRIEEGSYLITTQSDLVLYIEKVNGEPLGAARIQRYQIVDQSEDGFTLQEGPSMKMVLRKM